MGLLKKLKEKLSKTKQSIVEKIEGIVPAGGKIDEKTIEEVEEILISSDIGVKATEEITDILRKNLKKTQSEMLLILKLFLKKSLLSCFKIIHL